MKDIMGVLLLYALHFTCRSPFTSCSLKEVKNDKITAPDGASIEDRLKPLIERTADDIKGCSNVCDAYMKKRPLAKVMLSPAWDAKLLDFMNLFSTRRRDIQFQLTIHTSLGVDKANTKLDSIEDASRELNKQLRYLYYFFPSTR
jgi:hypothetical protein